MTEAMYSFTTKIAGDLLTVRGNSFDEFDLNLSDLVGSPEFLAKLQELQALTTVAPMLNQQAPVVAQYSQPVGEQSPGVGGSPVAAQQAQPAPALSVVQALADKYGNEWTYGLPDAPPLPDGRGRYARKDWRDRSGVERHAWVDPAKGPRPFAVGTSEAAIIWIR